MLATVLYSKTYIYSKQKKAASYKLMHCVKVAVDHRKLQSSEKYFCKKNVYDGYHSQVS